MQWESLYSILPDRRKDGHINMTTFTATFFQLIWSTAIKSVNLSSTKLFLQDYEKGNMFWMLLT